VARWDPERYCSCAETGRLRRASDRGIGQVIRSPPRAALQALAGKRGEAAFMASVSRYGRDITTVFDLLGTHEPALTAALGWTMARSSQLMAALLTKLGLDGPTHSHDVAVHLESADALGRTDIEIFTPAAHVILEAKQGWIVPGEMQLVAYVPRFGTAAAGGLEKRLITLSDSTPDWAREVLPPEVEGVPVIHWSWDDIRDLIHEARRRVRGIERLWLDQMEEYMGAATSKRPVTDSLAYCVVIRTTRSAMSASATTSRTSVCTSTPLPAADGRRCRRTSSRSAGTTRCASSTGSSTTRSSPARAGADRGGMSLRRG
jgi:hypothetical protein